MKGSKEVAKENDRKAVKKDGKELEEVGREMAEMAQVKEKPAKKRKLVERQRFNMRDQG